MNILVSAEGGIDCLVSGKLDLVEGNSGVCEIFM